MGDGSGFQVGERAPSHYQVRVEKLMAPFVSALVAEAIRPGDRVLDVACGTGFATRAAARVAGPQGTVIGSDVNPGMVVAARSVPCEGFDITWQEASALDLPFADGEFDAVISQQGVQFFPSPASGLQEMARVLRPEGRLAVTVWGEIEQNPFFAAEIDMLVNSSDAEPGAGSDAFPIGGDNQIRLWFEEAGLGEPRVELIESIISLPPPSEYVPQHLKALPWSSAFFELPFAAQAEAMEPLIAQLAEYATSGGIAVPFRSHLASVTV